MSNKKTSILDWFQSANKEYPPCSKQFQKKFQKAGKMIRKQANTPFKEAEKRLKRSKAKLSPNKLSPLKPLEKTRKLNETSIEHNQNIETVILSKNLKTFKNN